MSSSVDFSLPKLGPEMESGVLADWLVAEGDTVELGQPLATIETDKVSTDLESPAAGRIGALVEAGVEYPVGTPLATIGDGAATSPDAAPIAAKTESPSPTTATATTVPTDTGITPAAPPEGDTALGRTAITERRRGEPLASPVARRMAQAHGVSLADIRRTVSQGTIRKRHVEAFIADRDARPPAAPTSRTTAPPTAPLVAGTTTPLTTMRKRISERMRSSLLETAQITDFREHEVSDLIALRQAGVRWASVLGFRPSFTDLLVRAAALALRAVPALNVSMTDDRLTVHDQINVGVAVAIPDGLVVPVVRRADELSLSELHDQIVRLVDRARTDALDLGDLSGGTFTVTNIGSYGSEIATPILVPGQVGIVATGSFVKKPVVRDDRIVVGTVMSTSLTIDHRVVDGETAGRFQTEIGELLRNPDRLL